MEAFSQQLLAILEAELSDEEATKEFVSSFLKHGSHTTDNKNATKHIVVRTIDDAARPDTRSQTLVTATSRLTLLDLIDSLEEEEMPAVLAKLHPDLTQDEYRSAMRVIIMILSDLERVIQDS